MDYDLYEYMQYFFAIMMTTGTVLFLASSYKHGILKRKGNCKAIAVAVIGFTGVMLSVYFE